MHPICIKSLADLQVQHRESLIKETTMFMKTATKDNLVVEVLIQNIINLIKSTSNVQEWYSNKVSELERQLKTAKYMYEAALSLNKGDRMQVEEVLSLKATVKELLHTLDQDREFKELLYNKILRK